MSPQRSNLVLSSNIPNCKANVLVFDGFDVEADCRNCGDDFTQFQFVQYRGLPGCVQADHQNANLFFAEQAGKQRRNGQTHGDRAKESRQSTVRLTIGKR